MATTITSIISRVRKKLHEPAEVSNGMWTDAELLEDLTAGVKDLHRVFKDNYQNYFFTRNAADVTLPASPNDTITTFPTNLMILLGIEPRDLAAYRHIKFVMTNDIMHPDFQEARAQSAALTTDVGSGTEIFVCLTDAGAPVAAPSAIFAPKMSAAIPLTIYYVPTLTLGANNPIPGESDNALVCWTVAYAKSKVREDQEPDPDWLELYKTEKANIQTAITPRQEQDEERVAGYLEGVGDWW